MNIQPLNTRRLLLFIQCLIFFIFENYLSNDLKFFSAYGTLQTYIYYPLYILPLLLLLSTFIIAEYQPYFFFIGTLALLKNTNYIFTVAIFSFGFFYVATFFKKKSSVTLLLITIIFATTLYSGLSRAPSENINWIWVMLHMSWSLKMIAWVVSVRIYNLNFNFNQFLDYFFNPVFYFLTNDLNVLTPRKLFSSQIPTDQFSSSDFRKTFSLSLIGIFLLFVYGLFQKYYFYNLAAIGPFSSIWVGGFLSIFVAILFHAANSTLQVSLLNAYKYNLEVDMNKPWLAASPADYWKRMHFYVRDYIFEIIGKPLLTQLERWNSKPKYSNILLICVLYFLFTCTQIGYQPFRLERSVQVGFLVTGVFVMMMAVPELILNDRQKNYILNHKVWGRLLTFIILYLGYTFIFYTRRGF